MADTTSMDLPELIAAVLDVDVAAVDHPWDSLGQVYVALVLEERYGVRFSTQEILELKTLEQARTVLHRHGVQA